MLFGAASDSSRARLSCGAMDHRAALLAGFARYCSLKFYHSKIQASLPPSGSGTVVLEALNTETATLVEIRHQRDADDELALTCIRPQTGQMT